LGKDAQMKVMIALITLLEKMLNVTEGSFLERYVKLFTPPAGELF